MESQVRAAHSHFSVLLKLRGLTVFSAFVRGFKAHAESLKSTGFQAFGYEVKEFDAFRAPCCRRNPKGSINNPEAPKAHRQEAQCLQVPCANLL